MTDLPSSSSIHPSKDSRIAYAKVHPGIGVCRVGDAKTEFFLSPETDQIRREPGDYYRDKTGALKREAQRFRLYGYNTAGEVVAELNSDNADITWTVHLVNRKADWFQFVTAMDIHEAQDLVVNRRNPKIEDRSRLIIDPGPRSISGTNVSGGHQHTFDTGKFADVKVPLGSLQTDDKGRLIVLGGHGKSASPNGKGLVNPDDRNWFNNSNDWYDDTSDGPVTAEVNINGERLPVTGGWCVVTPPNYSPDTIGWRTLYDLLTDTAINAGMLKVPPRTHFQRDVLPQLTRMSNLQWVNKGFAAFFGAGGAMDFQNDTVLLDKLAMVPQPDPANPSKRLDPYQELRQNIYNTFRPHTITVNDPRVWPWIYGDAFDGQLETDTSPRTMLAVPPLQLLHLQRWAAGDFEQGESKKPMPRLEALPLAEQPAMLDKAALFFCLADAFHPGCEMTWPMRHATLYCEPYRIRAARPEDPVLTFGKTLNQAQALALNGPLTHQSPGDITRWMGLPWQGDTAFCRAGYSQNYDAFLPTFWPARVPNNVLSDADYKIVLNENKDKLPEERLAAFNRRVSWNRFMDTVRQPGQGPQVVMEEMVKTFGAQGLVARVDGPDDVSDFPKEMYVETLPPHRVEAARLMAAAAASGTAPQEEANFSADEPEFRQAVINLRSRRGDEDQE